LKSAENQLNELNDGKIFDTQWLNNNLYCKNCYKVSYFFSALPENYFKQPTLANFSNFWSIHPIQPKFDVPFAPTKAFNRNDGVNRKWVSYSFKHKALFCCICICYGDGTGPFSKGFTDWKHVYTRISEHENSKKHKMNVDAHIMKKNYGSIDSLIT